MTVSDSLRDRALADLTAAVGDGRLTLADFDRRSELVVSARTSTELAATTSDLGRPASRTAPPSAAWLPWATVGILCSVIYVITCVATGSMLYPWPVWVIGPWGLVLLTHTIAPSTSGFSCASASSRAARPWEKATR